MSNEYIREKKEEKPIIAICYDFDKTLSPTDMQAQGYIQSVGYDIGEFWHRSNTLASENEMDQNLSYMYVMKQESEGKVLFTKETLMEYGSKVQLFPGVEDWFNRICQYGDKKGVIVEHYIISSGLKEMIEGTSVAKEGAFKKIYASSFYYNEKGVAIWRHGKIQGCVQTANFFWISKGLLALGIKQMQFAEINIHENVFAWARDRVIADGNQLTLFTLDININAVAVSIVLHVFYGSADGSFRWTAA